MTIDEKRREMSRAALRRDTATYQRLKYEIALLESEVRLQEPTSDYHPIPSETEVGPIDANMPNSLSPEVESESLDSSSLIIDNMEVHKEGESRDSVNLPQGEQKESESSTSGLDDSRLCDSASVSAQGVNPEGAESLTSELSKTFHHESFDEIAAALAAKESPVQPQETDGDSLPIPSRVVEVESPSILSSVNPTEESILTPLIANTGPDCPQSNEELGLDSTARIAAFDDAQLELSEKHPRMFGHIKGLVDASTPKGESNESQEKEDETPESSGSNKECIRHDRQTGSEVGESSPSEKSSIASNAKRICNHCSHEFIGEIPWSAYVDEDGAGPVPRCEFCGIGRVMTVVGDLRKSPKCYHKCPKCYKTWTHNLVPKDVDVLHGCAIFTTEEAICSSCERIRQEVRDEFMRLETHRSEQKMMNAPILDKNQLFFIVEEENYCKNLSDEEIEARIKEMDALATEYIGRSKGTRKARAARFDALDDDEKQRMRQEWKEVGSLISSEKIKKAREKKEITAADKNEKGIQAMMLAHDYDRARAEVAWQKLLEDRKKK